MGKDVKIFVRFLKDENIYNMFQTEVIRQFVFGENLNKTMELEKYNMYKVIRVLLSYNINPLANMLIWRESKQGVMFWENKRKKFGKLIGEYICTSFPIILTQ